MNKDVISLCSHCYCMTKTINKKCGKCGGTKMNETIEVCKTCGSKDIATQITYDYWRKHKIKTKLPVCIKCHSYDITKITNKKEK